MAEKNRATLKQQFQDNDTLTEDSFIDLIDSKANLQATTAQSFTSNLSVPGIAATTVSADTGYFDVAYIQSMPNRDSYTRVYIPVTALVTASAASTYMEVDVSTVDTPLAVNFTSTSGKVTYTGTVTAAFSMQLMVSNENDTADQVGQAAIFKNGTIVTGSRQTSIFTTLPHSFSTQAFDVLNPNDVITVRLAVNTTAAAVFKLHDMSLMISPLGVVT